jgi:hypothetical protein
MGDPEHTFAVTARDIPVLTEQKFYFWLASAMVNHGWAQAMRGDVAARASNAQAGLAILNNIGVRADAALPARPAGGDLLQQDAVTDALATVDEALGLSSEFLDCMYVPELQRLKGECKLRSQQTVAAEAHFRTALDLAVEQGGRSFALRSA